MNRRLVGALVAAAGLGLAAAATAFSPTAARAPIAEPVQFKVDAVHSSVVFGVKHMDIATFWGRFNQISGTIQWNEADPTASTIEIVIPADSIDTNNEGRDRHLKNHEFFNTPVYPNVTFTSKSITKAADGKWEVVGDITVLDQTKSMSFTINPPKIVEGQRGKAMGFDAEFTIKRSDFGMNFMVGRGLGDEVRVFVGLEAKPG